ncbi:hypothetical protein [Flavobacterium microcysteis]|uniref:Peptidase A2 domain-containing protein n=1 Tax=Flavobacterium microcysteis TaxID=2596891 RepID=A0A501QLN7_9FLAO|nr:hypothetical protein [Flavobacterium microcysteis]TPD73388.1 hypothetical protein FJA49_01485 [Flavobacterium microcysteis]
MKTLKKILLGLLVLFVVSLIGGYFYFEKKFSPPENYLDVSGISEDIPMQWEGDDENPYAALLLPVRIKGIDKPFFMQLDLGSPVTVFYKNSLESVKSLFPDKIPMSTEKGKIALDFLLQKMKVSSGAYEVLDYGSKADFENPDARNIIGTIGTDLLEKRIITLDFKNSRCSFSKTIEERDFSKFEFKKRRILIPATIGDENLKLMYDSGTSGYELIMNRDKWEKYKTNNTIKTEKGNSWGKELKVITALSDQEIRFGNKILQLSEVTCIEGTSKAQNFLMKLSGMQGMIGNKLFLNRKIILDCGNQVYKIE